MEGGALTPTRSAVKAPVGAGALEAGLISPVGPRERSGLHNESGVSETGVGQARSLAAELAATDAGAEKTGSHDDDDGGDTAG